MKILFSKKCLRGAALILYASIILLSLEANANNVLDVGCLASYQSWVKPSDSLEVSAAPSPIKIKMLGVKAYYGEVPHGCGGHIPAGAQLKIFTLNNKLYSLDLTMKTSKPYFSQYISLKEISRMEAAFRKNNYALSSFATSIDKSMNLDYQIEVISSGFLEHLYYKSPESAKYE